MAETVNAERAKDIAAEAAPEGTAGAPDADVPIPEPKKASSPTHFNFEHAVFKVK